VAGLNACYMLMAFIYLRMELLWRSNPIGEVCKDLPFFKEFDDKKYIKKINSAS
jgi:hypothetical protein